jgi:hypothetical protein
VQRCWGVWGRVEIVEGKYGWVPPGKTRLSNLLLRVFGPVRSGQLHRVK